ncbi:hypothetical protein N9R54_04030 [Pelobium sp.]|nr:hypothetical protein [Pelobium sp.]MDA9555382.1 hypothetical protein [Pelobium sp.]
MLNKDFDSSKFLTTDLLDKLPFSYIQELDAYQLTDKHKSMVPMYYSCKDNEVFIFHKDERITVSWEINTYEKLNQFLSLLFRMSIDDLY